ncbi:ATP-dependent DNA helicase RecG [Patescibacteria group bacterium]|nr:ATP-dependent DNA helicase RecG [Patescibacteria group bacterium]
MQLTTPLSEVPRIGPVYQKRLKTMGITTCRDLLFHFPRMYHDLSTITPIGKAKEGFEYCFQGTLGELQEMRTYRKRISVVEGVLSDKTGSIKVVWFNQPYLKDTLSLRQEVFLAGKVVRDQNGIHLQSPAYEKMSRNPIHMARLVPVYQETRGVSSKWLRFVIHMVLDSLKNIQDTLPSSLLKERGFPSLKDALFSIHFPNNPKDAQLARKRFSFEELFFISLFVLTERKKLSEVKAPVVAYAPDIMKRFTSKLSFELTDAQKKAAWHILKDMEKPRPMNRILQGDVGSGKTVVAAMASLAAVKAGYQAVLMAPTEVLAQQHFKTVGESLALFRITIGLLTGKTDRFISPKLPNDSIEISRKKLLKRVKEGTVDVLIGTHALIQDKVKFNNLALVIIDEQHRFGVQQRKKLQHRSQLIPHFLSMTATPIPRTLAMSVYGDLDPTIIDELPKGRKRIETKIVAPEERAKAYKFIAKEVKKGRQVFVICPRIEKVEEGEKSELKTVKEEYEKLSRDVFPGFEVAMLHGKMGAPEKEQIMRRFKRGKTDILVSTSVVEVGVDIPNASVMMIEGADRFGLAQLHQFRGRVGRSRYQSYCLLFSESKSAATKQRLKALLESENGFQLAERDLELRGPGDFSGNKQWGLPDFAMKNLANLPLVQETREAAEKLLEQDISLKNHPLLKKRVEELREKLHLE